MISKTEMLDDLKEAVSHLPVDKFVKVDIDGACYVDWDHIDADDFKDNAKDFAKAMVKIKAAQLKIDYKWFLITARKDR